MACSRVASRWCAGAPGNRCAPPQRSSSACGSTSNSRTATSAPSPRPVPPGSASRSRCSGRDRGAGQAQAATGRAACSRLPFCAAMRWLHVPLHGNRSAFMKRTASAAWSGDLKQGKGSVSTQSGVLKDTQYSFSTRFENGIGTNPEELIAAAHAGCFTMATSAALGRAGFKPEKLATNATLTLEQVSGNWTITTVDLQMTARVPGIDANKFQEVAADAKANCPVSRVLNAKISLDA